MKKFLLKCALFALLIAAAVIPFQVVIDPYNVFHPYSPINNGVEPNKNFIKTKYMIKYGEDFDSLFFGSSRAGFLDCARMENGHYYNMSCSEAVPAEHLKTLKILVKHGRTPKNVVVLVDEISCFVDAAMHEDVLYRKPYPTGSPMNWLRFYASYLNPKVTMEGYEIVKVQKDVLKTADPDYVDRFHQSGTEKLDMPSGFAGVAPDGSEIPGYWMAYYQMRLEEAMADLREMKAFCEEHGISLTVMITPTYYKTYVESVNNGYLDFLEALSAEMPIYSFAGLNSITMAPSNYYEASHFTTAVGDMMLDTIQGKAPSDDLQKQGFGVLITAENREAWLELLRTQMEAYQ